MLDAGATRLSEAVRQTFEDPERVAASLVDTVRLGALTGDALAHRLRQAPEEFGTLRGERSLLGRDDAARTTALDALPRIISAVQDLGRTHDTLKVSLTADETQFRERMREPVRDLSPEAKAVVSKFHADRSFVPGEGDEQGLRELKAFSNGLQERFGTTNGRIDLQRLSDAIGDPARAEAFAGGMQRTQATVSGIAATSQGQGMARAMSQAQAQEQAPSSGHGLGPSISLFPPVK